MALTHEKKVDKTEKLLANRKLGTTIIAVIHLVNEKDNILLYDACVLLLI